ncbi:MAG TPA: YciI-like protein [Vicinamibacterales bacterium]|nr:YciI-like protein [Vicinamibacterales bacterium]
MPYFALMYDVVEDFVNKRTPFRPAHLAEVRESHGRGELVMAGALAEPAGALLVFRAADRSTAENFAKNDPYVKEGLVRGWQVRPWTVVVGQDPSETPAGLPS